MNLSGKAMVPMEVEGGLELIEPNETELKAIEAEIEVEGETDDDPEKEAGAYGSNEISDWLRPFAKYKVPNRWEFNELFYRWRNDGDAEAYDLMVYGNVRLAVKVGVRFQYSGVPVTDLFQEGIFGIMRALDLYDPGYGYRFATYAGWWIKQRILRAIDDYGSATPFRVANSMQGCRKIVWTAMRTFAARYGRLPSIDEIYEQIQTHGSAESAKRVTRSILSQVLELEARRYLPYDGTFMTNEDGGLLVAETIPSDSLPDPESFTITADEVSTMMAQHEEAWQAAKKFLPKKWYVVLRARLYHRETLNQAADKIGNSRERARQVQVAALKKMARLLSVNSAEAKRRLIFSRNDDGLKKMEKHCFSPEQVFWLLTEHAVEDGLGRVLIKAPINTLKLRTSLSEEQIIKNLELVVGKGWVQGEWPWDCLEVLTKIELPKFLNYRPTRKGANLLDIPIDRSKASRPRQVENVG